MSGMDFTRSMMFGAAVIAVGFGATRTSAQKVTSTNYTARSTRARLRKWPVSIWTRDPTGWRTSHRPRKCG